MKRKRNILLRFFVDESEHALIREKMSSLGTENLSAYLRKMAIDGHIIKLDLPELREMLTLLRLTSNNVNQIARRVNATGRVYESDLSEICDRQEELWNAANEILKSLSRIP